MIIAKCTFIIDKQFMKMAKALSQLSSFLRVWTYYLTQPLRPAVKVDGNVYNSLCKLIMGLWQIIYFSPAFVLSNNLLIWFYWWHKNRRCWFLVEDDSFASTLAIHVNDLFMPFIQQENGVTVLREIHHVLELESAERNSYWKSSNRFYFETINS